MLKYLSICATLIVLSASSVSAQQTNFVSHRVEVPGAHFSIVFVFSKPKAGPTIVQPDQLPALAVYPTGDALAYATESEVEKMFKNVGLSQIPIHAFRVEQTNSKPSNAVNVYVIPNGKPTALPMR